MLPVAELVKKPIKAMVSCHSRYDRLLIKRSRKVEIALKAEVLNYLEMMFDESTWPETDPVACVDTIWNDRWLGLQDLIVARDELDVAANGGAGFGISFDEEPKRPTRVMRMLAAPPLMLAIIERG
ncbi:MAG TPA: hypothetical protein DDZ51_21420, partial [Planctomycetaceae bacterium]|nr:hypothetical protein [Planctomycetaceae bacterium]